MSNRRNQNDDATLALMIGAGLVGVAGIATLVVGAALNDRNDSEDDRRRRSSSSGPSFSEVLDGIVTVAGAVATTANALNHVIGQPSSSRRSRRISISEINEPETEERQTQCKICYRQLFLQPVEELTCKHKFHSTCIRKWMTDNYECPVCRRKARLA